MRVKNEPLPESNRLRTPRESMQAQSRRNAVINQTSRIVRHRHETMRRIPRIAQNGPTYFVLKSVAGDYLTCRQINWTDGGPEYTEGDEDVYIAKPFHLQKQWYHGKTIASRTYTYTGAQARTVTYGGDREDQIIIPIYQIADGDYKGDLIFAEYVSGGTGVKVGDEVVYWQERSDGRGYVSEDTA